MTSTITIQDLNVNLGSKNAVLFDIDTTSYASGGEALTKLGFTPECLIGVDTENAYIPVLDRTNNKLKWFTGATTEAGAVDVGTARFYAVRPSG